MGTHLIYETWCVLTMDGDIAGIHEIRPVEDYQWEAPYCVLSRHNYQLGILLRKSAAEP